MGKKPAVQPRTARVAVAVGAGAPVPAVPAPATPKAAIPPAAKAAPQKSPVTPPLAPGPRQKQTAAPGSAAAPATPKARGAGKAEGHPAHKPLQQAAIPEKTATAEPSPCSVAPRIAPLTLPEPAAAYDGTFWGRAALVLSRARMGLETFLRPQGRAMRLVTACVLLPGLLVFLYLALWASDMYISDARFAIRGRNSTPSMDTLSSLFRVSTSTQSDSYIVLHYITSLDMCSKLDGALGLRAHYSDRVHDIWYRLWRDPTQDEMRDYWQWAVTVAYDPDTGILSVSVKAFSADMAYKICQGILENSEALVNAMNERARKDAISQAQLEVGRAEGRIRAAQAALRSYRERTIILDPQAVASGLYGVVNELEASATQTAAELAEALTFMQGNSPRVVQLRNRLAVLQKQLETEKQRLAGDLKQDTPLSALVSEFQSLALEEEFAQKQLTSAMASLETARVQADAQALYVEAFEQPILPDESLYPRPVYFTFIFMVTALLLLGLVSLIIAAVREHAGF